MSKLKKTTQFGEIEMSKTVYEGICRYCGIKEIIAENIAYIRRKLEDITPSDLLEFCRNFGWYLKLL